MIRARALIPLAAAPALLAVGLLAKTQASLVLINETPSLPRGVYLRTAAPLAHGAVVTVSTPLAAAPYLRSLGAPRDARLLKRVAAMPGDEVCRCGQTLRWRDRAVTALTRDRRGVMLPAWRGCRRLGADQVLVVGDTPASFDSRYFGPVAVDAVAGPYREIWRW